MTDYNTFSQEFEEKHNAEMEAKLADIEANTDKELLDFHYNLDTKQRFLKQKDEIYKKSKSNETKTSGNTPEDRGTETPVTIPCSFEELKKGDFPFWKRAILPLVYERPIKSFLTGVLNRN